MFFMRNKRSSGTALLLLSLSIMACNNPYGDFGAKLDSSSWIDIGKEGALPYVRVYDGNNNIEILVFEGEILGASDQFGSINIIRILNSGTGSGESPRHDVYLFQGAYTLSGSNITVDLKKRYTVYYERMESISVSGSQTETDIDSTFRYTNFTTSESPTDITVSLDTEDGTSTYHRLDLIIDSMMSGSHTAEKAADIHRLCQITGVFLPQSRIAGFGGMNMMNYTNTTAFRSLMNTPSGDHHIDLTVKVGLITTTTTFEFIEASDLKPFRLEGSYINKSDMSGSGSVSFSLEGKADTWYCDLDYNGISIDRTIADSGNYLLSIDGEGPYSIGFDNVNPGVMNFSFISDIISGL